MLGYLLLCLFAILFNFPNVESAGCIASGDIRHGICSGIKDCLCSGQANRRLTLISPRRRLCNEQVPVAVLQNRPHAIINDFDMDKSYMMIHVEVHPDSTLTIRQLYGDMDEIVMRSAQQLGYAPIGYLPVAIAPGAEHVYQMMLFEQPAPNTTLVMNRAENFAQYDSNPSLRKWNELTDFLRRYDLCDKLFAGYQLRVINETNVVTNDYRYPNMCERVVYREPVIRVAFNTTRERFSSTCRCMFESDPTLSSEMQFASVSCGHNATCPWRVRTVRQRLDNNCFRTVQSTTVCCDNTTISSPMPPFDGIDRTFVILEADIADDVDGWISIDFAHEGNIEGRWPQAELLSSTCGLSSSRHLEECVTTTTGVVQADDGFGGPTGTSSVVQADDGFGGPTGTSSEAEDATAHPPAIFSAGPVLATSAGVIAVVLLLTIVGGLTVRRRKQANEMLQMMELSDHGLNEAASTDAPLKRTSKDEERKTSTGSKPPSLKSSRVSTAMGKHSKTGLSAKKSATSSISAAID